ncbi:MAG: TonB-dependent receptor [Methylococcaceae bacterium]|nr:TonB-dependent receptor [Methylococcaceae bacterium]
MKKYAYLNINNGLVLLILSGLTNVSQSALLPEEIDVHGYLTQGFFHSSDNNFFGQSDDGISPSLTEIGINTAYQPISRLRFAAQGLYRRAGDIDPGSIRLDYGLADLILMNHESGKIGIRGGRIKIPFGLYNETRDMPFTHPTILLPQGIYFDRSRSLLLSADGGSLYAEQRTRYGDFAFKFNVGMPLGPHKEIQAIVLGTGDAQGKLEGKPAIATQLTYELNGGEYVFAVSYMDLELDYQPAAGEAMNASTAHIQPLLFSAQYNGEKFTLTGEYNYRWNTFGAFAPEGKFITESWYVQGSYQVLPELQATVRYDVIYMDKDDKRGDGAALLGYQRHSAFGNDWMVGLRWDITTSWMLRADYHRIHGTAVLSQADNPDRQLTRPDWDLYGLQLSFRF